jgi:hypothetical protein
MEEFLESRLTHTRHGMVFTVLLMIGGLQSCGVDSFVEIEENNRSFTEDPSQSNNDSTANEDSSGNRIGPVSINPDNNIVWALWPCDDLDPAPTVTMSSNDILLANEGPHELNPSADFAVPLRVAGSFCKAEQFGREIVFVIDVSESMRDRYNYGSDPVNTTTGRCKRLEAINAVVDSFKPEDRVRFALSTFASQARTDSGGFWEADDFKAKFATTAIVCQIGDGTNYQAGLEKAQQFLYSGKAGYSKEVYFITDGLPQSADTDGREAAAQIRAIGMVGTILIGSNDQFLKTTIASKKLDGTPLHVSISTAASLATQLVSMNTSTIAGGSVVYRSLASPTVGTKYIVDPAKNQNFEINNTQPSKADYPDGLEVTFSFYDSRSALFKKSGKIVWTP